MTLPIHGGDVDAASHRWGQPVLGWLDLSTGIAPWPWPVPALPPQCWTRLPGAAEDRALRQAAAHAYGRADPQCVVAGPGSGAIIQALPRLRPPGVTAILSPTYGEHGRAWAAAGHRVVQIERLEQGGDAQVVVVVNPNNPDGRQISPQSLLAIAAHQAEHGGWLVVDEAFGDLTPALSVAGQAVPGLVVLRSFGKFFGLAGLRLGFALTMPDLAAELAAHLGPWAVPGPAQIIGTQALADLSWQAEQRNRLAAQADRLDDVLEAAGLWVSGGTSLFRLAAHAQAADIYDRLGRAGILVRAFTTHPHWLRIGLPMDEDGLDRLAAALTE